MICKQNYVSILLDMHGIHISFKLTNHVIIYGRNLCQKNPDKNSLIFSCVPSTIDWIARAVSTSPIGCVTLAVIRTDIWAWTVCTVLVTCAALLIGGWGTRPGTPSWLTCRIIVYKILYNVERTRMHPVGCVPPAAVGVCPVTHAPPCHTLPHHTCPFPCMPPSHMPSPAMHAPYHTHPQPCTPLLCMPPTTHTPWPHMPPPTMHASCHACPPYMPLPCMPHHACPLPCPPGHACLPATHAPCHACPLPRMPPAMQGPTCEQNDWQTGVKT